jgi:hypothetical protein
MEAGASRLLAIGFVGNATFRMIFAAPLQSFRLLATGLVGNSITKADRKITIGFFQPK